MCLPLNRGCSDYARRGLDLPPAPYGTWYEIRFNMLKENQCYKTRIDMLGGFKFLRENLSITSPSPRNKKVVVKRDDDAAASLNPVTVAA